MKAKDVAAQLGGLCATTQRMGGNYNVNDVDADIPEEIAEADPIFMIDHDVVLKAMEQKAFKSIQQIVNTIVPTIYQRNPVIKDKMDQDGLQLGQLYYQQTMNNVMIKALMDTIAKGAIEAKMFDVYTKLMAMAKDLNKQINEMQNQFRKYYIDTYLDLQHKEDEDQILEESTLKTQKTLTVSTDSNSEMKQIAHTNKDTEGNMDLRETSTKDTVTKIQDWKRDIYRNKFLQEQTSANS